MIKMVHDQKGDRIDWKLIVKALAEQVPMGGGQRRMSKNCVSHRNHICELKSLFSYS